jgi:eukaryotic-like serine/threonine-protein kinase
VASGVPDNRFAEYIIQSKLVSPEQVEEARRSQAAAVSIGIEISLAEALVRMQALTPSQRSVIEQRIANPQPSGGIHQLGHYRLLRRIGAGAMGVVYLAEDTMAQRQVALKVLARELASNPTFLERFHREAVASGKLNHANLITAYNFDEDRGWRYYVMEYCPGESAEQMLEHRGPLPWPQALRIARDVAQGLHYAHQQGIIHRDVKPGNIMVTPEGVSRLLDMGLSKQQLERDEKSGRTVGTPHYISPEQARGVQALDGRADIYSLGATLFHLLTGRPPYAGNDSIEVMRQHVSAPIPDAAAVRADVPERVSRIVQRMMAKEPAQRYTDCAELIADLDLALVAEEPTSAIAMKPSPARPAKALSPVHRQGAHPPSIWGGAQEAAERGGMPASVWGATDQNAPAVRPAPGRAAHAAPEPLRSLRPRHGSEADLLVPHPRMKQNVWLWPAIGAGGVLLLLAILLLMLNTGGTSSSKQTNANPTPPVKAPNQKPTLPAPLESTGTGKTATATNLPPQLPPPPQIPAVPPLPPTPGVDNEERWKGAVNLLSLLDLTTDPVQGTWRYVGNALTNDATPRARISLPLQPAQEYDFRIVFTRKKGDEVTQILSWKGTGVAWVMGAVGNTASGFLRANTELSPPFKAQDMKGLTNEKRHSTIIEVRKDRVRGYLDGQLLSEWTGESKDLTWHPGWDLPGEAKLGLGSHNADLVIHSIQVLDISGSAKVTRKPSPLNGPGEITDEWKRELAKLEPEEQLKHVNVKLQQLNPGFTGKVTMWVDEEKKLRYIGLVHALLKDLTPLHGLPHLSGIGLGGTEDYPSPLADLSLLAGLRLGYVDCSYSKVTSLAPLAGLKLSQVICHHTDIADLSPLAKMPLYKMNCSATKVQDLTPLAGTSLTELDCSGTGVSDLGPLAGQPLKELDISGTGVSNLAPLKGMALKKLNLHGCTALKDLTVLAGMPLTELNLGETGVSDFAPLKGMKLTVCRLDDLNLKQVDFLEGMPITILNVAGNKLSDLSSLEGLPLAELHLSRNPVSDLGPLRGKSIESLFLRGTKVTSLDALEGMALHTLDIHGLTIKNPAMLKSLPLTTLFLDYVPAQHAELLKSIKTLERVNGYLLSTFLTQPPTPKKKAD